MPTTETTLNLLENGTMVVVLSRSGGIVIIPKDGNVERRVSREETFVHPESPVVQPA